MPRERFRMDAPRALDPPAAVSTGFMVTEVYSSWPSSGFERTQSLLYKQM